MQEDVDEGEDEEEISTVNDDAYIMQDVIEAQWGWTRASLLFKTPLVTWTSP